MEEISARKGSGQVRSLISRDAIDRKSGLIKMGWELFKRNDLSSVPTRLHAVYHYIAGACNGRSECWVSTRRMAADLSISRRTAQLHLAALEKLEKIARPADRSLQVQRRIVLVNHPNSAVVFNRLVAKSMQLGAQAGGFKLTPEVHPGAQADVGAGAQASAPKWVFPQGEYQAEVQVVCSSGGKLYRETADRAVMGKAAGPACEVVHGKRPWWAGGTGQRAKPRSMADSVAWLEASIARNRGGEVAQFRAARE